jgi:MFS family permease
MATAGAHRTSLPVVIAIACGCLIGTLTFGVRSSFGIFQLPMLADLGWDRTTFGLALAIQNLLWGAGQPIFGAIADRYGTARVLLICAILYMAGLLTMAWATAPLMLHVGAGVLIGFAVAAGSFGIILSAFARITDPEKRSIVFGIGTAASSFGMFVFSPVSRQLIESFGWSDSLVIFAALMGLIPLLALPLRGKPSSAAGRGVRDQSIRQALDEAFAHKSYLLLVAGFFVCGFQVAFIAVHFPAYVSDLGLAPSLGAWAIALIGLFNIFGSLGSGFIGQRYSKPMFLTWIYLGRSIAFTAFLLLPVTAGSVIVFSIIIGILWLSTVPPTNALVAIMFGTRHLGLLGGMVFFSHQIGSFSGIWLGGYFFDVYGSYDPVWWTGVGLGIFAAIVHWPIREKPVERISVAS